ncbi:hypothetical protein D9M69_720700 [compost metagenome]
MGIFDLVPESIHKAGVDKLFHPCSFFRKETGSAGIGFRIMNIYISVAYVNVSTDQERRALLFKLCGVGVKVIQEPVFNFLAYFTGGA